MPIRENPNPNALITPTPVINPVNSIPEVSIIESAPTPNSRNSVVSLVVNQTDALTNISNTEWVTVRNNTKTSQSGKHPSAVKIFGTDTSSTLNVFPNLKWFHVSKFRVDTNSDDIVNHIVLKTGIPSNLIQSIKLIKKDAVISDLKYINFKISVPANMVNSAIDPAVWPLPVQIKKFVSQR